MNIINLDFFKWHLLFNLYLLIPQLLIILKEIVMLRIEKYAHEDTECCENDRTLRKIRRARKLWFDKKLPWKFSTGYGDCLLLYRSFWWLTVIMDVVCFISFITMLMYPIQRSTIKEFIEKDYPFYSSLEHPTSKQCRTAEETNDSFLLAADGVFCLKSDHELINTEELWARFYLDVENKAKFLQEAGRK